MRLVKKHTIVGRALSVFLSIAFCVGIFSAFASSVSAAAGDLMSNAVNASFDKTYTKTWNKDTDHLNHYVKFTVSKRGVVTVVASKPFDDDSEYGRLYLTFYDKDGNAFYDNHTYNACSDAKSEYTVKVGLNPGTYYMTLKPGFTVQTGTIVTNYKLSFKANEYCEIEENESAATATKLTLGKKYTAWMGNDYGDYGDYDYFKFAVESGRSYEVAINNYSAMGVFSFVFYGPDGAEIPERTWGSETRYEKTVTADGLNGFKITVSQSGILYVRVSESGAQFEYGITARVRLCSSHSYGSWSTTKEATCKEDGKQTRTCSTCGSVETQTIEKKNHSYGSWNTTKQATCLESGSRVRTCSVCNREEKQEIEKLSTHNLSDWTIIKEAGCTESGEREATCADCQKKFKEAIHANGHVYDNDCDATCANCDYEREENHTYALTNDDNSHWEECTVCGDKMESSVHQPSKEGHFCTICGKTLSPELDEESSTSKSNAGAWIFVLVLVAVGGVVVGTYLGKQSTKKEE